MQVGLLEGARLKGASLVEVTSMPLNPKAGDFIFYQKRFLACVALNNGVPIWIPMSSEVSFYEHAQSEAALDWVIDHNLNTAHPFVQVLDENGQLVMPTNIDNSQKNRTVISMPMAMKGFAIFMVASQFGAPVMDVGYTQNFDGVTSVTVNHGLGRNPLVQVIVGGKAYDPASITFPTLNQVVLTFATAQSGSVRCV